MFKIFAGVAIALCLSTAALAQDTQRFAIDPYWPKPLPEKWIIGRTGSICSDAHDHLVVTNRRDITAAQAARDENARASTTSNSTRGA